MQLGAIARLWAAPPLAHERALAKFGVCTHPTEGWTDASAGFDEPGLATQRECWRHVSFLSHTSERYSRSGWCSFFKTVFHLIENYSDQRARRALCDALKVPRSHHPIRTHFKGKIKYKIVRVLYVYGAGFFIFLNSTEEKSFAWKFSHKSRAG